MLFNSVKIRKQCSNLPKSMVGIITSDFKLTEDYLNLFINSRPKIELASCVRRVVGWVSGRVEIATLRAGTVVGENTPAVRRRCSWDFIFC